MGGQLTRSLFWLTFILLMVPSIEKSKLFNRNVHEESQDSLMAAKKPWTCALTLLVVAQVFQPCEIMMTPAPSSSGRAPEVSLDKATQDFEFLRQNQMLLL